MAVRSAPFPPVRLTRGRVPVRRASHGRAVRWRPQSACPRYRRGRKHFGREVAPTATDRATAVERFVRPALAGAVGLSLLGVYGTLLGAALAFAAGVNLRTLDEESPEGVAEPEARIEELEARVESREGNENGNGNGD